MTIYKEGQNNREADVYSNATRQIIAEGEFVLNILVTGAKGFLGTNVVIYLKTLADGRNRTRPKLHIGHIYEYDIDSTEEVLDRYCKSADFVLNFAGVNRPQKVEEFQEGNFGFANTLLETLKKYNNICPVILSSSGVQYFPQR